MQRINQAGSSLIISLVFLLLLTMIGIASIQDSTLQERMAGNERDRNLAFQAAEAALREGEDFLKKSGKGFSVSAAGGLLGPDYQGTRPSELSYDWKNSREGGSTGYSGLQSLPRYVIEWIVTQDLSPSDDMEAPKVDSYRVTARAVGGSADAVVMLQSTVRR